MTEAKIPEPGETVNLTFDPKRVFMTGVMVGPAKANWWERLRKREAPSNAYDVKFPFIGVRRVNLGDNE